MIYSTRTNCKKSFKRGSLCSVALNRSKAGYRFYIICSAALHCLNNKAFSSLTNDFFIVPTHFSGGGTIYSNNFFVQKIMTDRYNHRSEL